MSLSQKRVTRWSIGCSLLLGLTLMLALSACGPSTPTPTPAPTLVPTRPNPMAGINGVAGAPGAIREKAAQTSAQWDRVVVRWNKVESGDPSAPR
jgi:hypothetical protein